MPCQADVDRCGIEMAQNPIMERQAYAPPTGHTACVLSYLRALQLHCVCATQHRPSPFPEVFHAVKGTLLAHGFLCVHWQH